ncbi:MAG: Gfo/Idh/MocA family protein [Isosphaeraceae bacterium]
MCDSGDLGPVLSRRTLLGGGAVATLSAASYRRVWGANERVGLGFIGFGLIGKRHVLDFRERPDANLAAIAEVHKGRRDEAAALMGRGGSVRAYADFRALLDDHAVDAVVVSTPDHWHALMTMMACAAGKDVYVEKPLSLFVREGRWMTAVARRHKRVVQVGTQQRSGPHYQKARELIQSGHIGKVVSVRMWSYRNVMPGFGSPADGEPPPELDYDMWLGPAPKRPYNPNRAIYHFRWFWDYSGGQMTNLGQHALDIAHWVLGATAPAAVTSAGGRLGLRDNGETPDVQDALFEYPGWQATWSHRECSRGAAPARGLEFCATKGSVTISRRGFIVTPDPRIATADAIPRFGSPHPVGGPAGSGSHESAAAWTSAIENRSGDEFDQFRRHAAEFIECVRSRREPISDLESAHRVASACHLSNLSLRLGRKLRWDAARETIVDDKEADGLLERPYRAPWDAERKALLGTG